MISSEMQDLKQFFHENGYIIRSNSIDIESLSDIVNRFFLKDTSYYCSMTDSEYYEHVYRAQVLINQEGFVSKLCGGIKNLIEAVFEIKDPSVTIAKLRAVRPAGILGKPDSVGFHREVMYGLPGQTEHVINFWIPIQNVSSVNSLRFVPNSHTIPTEELLFSQHESSVERFSFGHKVGFPYAPKNITGGVDLKMARNFEVRPGDFLAFNSNLIHGGAPNATSEIRFSIDFGLISSRKILTNKNHFAANGQLQYIPL